MSFNTETIYMLWDAEHDGETVNFVKEDADSYFFDKDGTELSLSKANVVNLGDAHPPADKEEGKHYISTYDGSVSYGVTPPSSNNNSSLPSSENSYQSGGRRKNTRKGKGKGKRGKKTKRKQRKSIK